MLVGGTPFHMALVGIPFRIGVAEVPSQMVAVATLVQIGVGVLPFEIAAVPSQCALASIPFQCGLALIPFQRGLALIPFQRGLALIPFQCGLALIPFRVVLSVTLYPSGVVLYPSGVVLFQIDVILSVGALFPSGASPIRIAALLFPIDAFLYLAAFGVIPFHTAVPFETGEEDVLFQRLKDVLHFAHVASDFAYHSDGPLVRRNRGFSHVSTDCCAGSYSLALPEQEENGNRRFSSLFHGIHAEKLRFQTLPSCTELLLVSFHDQNHYCVFSSSSHSMT
jgi:hypothetical protein